MVGLGFGLGLGQEKKIDLVLMFFLKVIVLFLNMFGIRVF